MDRLASFPQAPFTEGLDLNDVVVIWIEGQLHRGFVGDDGVHVVIPVSSVQHLRAMAPQSIKVSFRIIKTKAVNHFIIIKLITLQVHQLDLLQLVTYLLRKAPK